MIIAATRPTFPALRRPLPGNFLRRSLGDDAIDSLPSPGDASSLLSTVPTAPAATKDAPSTVFLTICTDPTAPGCSPPGAYGNSTITSLPTANSAASLFALEPTAGSPSGGPNGDANGDNNGGPQSCKILQWLHLAGADCKLDVPWWFWAGCGVAGVIVLKNATR